MTFTTPNLGGVSAGQAASYSFCRPPITGNDLCGATATNPMGGQPPYHFELGSGVGFPPIGMHLNLNGTLTGTPTAAGVSNFVVCAVDLAGKSVCDTVRFTVDAAVPAPAPGVGAGKYDGTYDFFRKSPAPGGQYDSINSPRYVIIRNGAISSTDRVIAGSVDSSGGVRFTAPCPINTSVADWTGIMNVSAQAGSNSGQGNYTCRIAIGGSMNTWQLTQSR